MLKVQEIRELIKLIDESSINEFTYETNGTIVTMKKISENKNVHHVLPQITVPAETQQAIAKVEEPKATTEEIVQDNAVSQEAISEAKYDFEIVSPMVGTFYSSPNPESDAYVKIGDKVGQETVVCIVEAMKLFNEIEAETTGEIVEVLVENGELVEYGQPLFRVKTK